ncbi:uncharacterized protein LOC121386610 [Gigantopelta aegis]|uniref:uncharacterized protein LOC121386610 n=1 Tax=Gigantopelta aegis TaxID=1735272 RepID=UPI001B8893B1|nr:uncharacterized protein LOC121386610 [Gigantopelta aegis]
MMAEFMFIDVGESDWRRTASKMCTLLVEGASWYRAVFAVNGQQGQTESERHPSSSTSRTEEETCNKFRNEVEKEQIKEKRLPSSSPFPTGIVLEEEKFNKLRSMIWNENYNFLTSSVSYVNGFVNNLQSCLVEMKTGEALVFITRCLKTCLNLKFPEHEPETLKFDIFILTTTYPGIVLSVGESSSLMDVTYPGEYIEAVARELAHQMKYFTKEYFNLLPISMTVDDLSKENLKENLKKKTEEMKTHQLLYYPLHRLEMDAAKYSSMVDAFVAIDMKSRVNRGVTSASPWIVRKRFPPHGGFRGK